MGLMQHFSNQYEIKKDASVIGFSLWKSDSAEPSQESSLAFRENAMEQAGWVRLDCWKSNGHIGLWVLKWRRGYTWASLKILSTKDSVLCGIQRIKWDANSSLAAQFSHSSRFCSDEVHCLLLLIATTSNVVWIKQKVKQASSAINHRVTVNVSIQDLQQTAAIITSRCTWLVHFYEMPSLSLLGIWFTTG